MKHFRSLLTNAVLRDVLGGIAVILMALAVLTIDGCSDNNQPRQPDMPRPSCTTNDVTRYVMEVQDVRQHCHITTLDERLCGPGVSTSAAKIGKLFEVTVVGRLLVSRIQVRVPGVTTMISEPHKVTSGRRFTATVVAADDALFHRVRVGDTIALCPWQDQKYAYELPDPNILEGLEGIKPSNNPSAVQGEHPGCDQPPCPTEGEGEGDNGKPYQGSAAE